MLIEIIDKPILIDKIETLKNVRLNIVEDHKFRLKMTYINDEHEEPVDIVVFNWSTPKLDKLKIIISIDGKEMIRSIPFNLKLSFDVIKRRWNLKGQFNNNTVNQELENAFGIFLAFQNLIKSTKKIKK